MPELIAELGTHPYTLGLPTRVVDLFTRNTTPFYTPPSPQSEVHTISDTTLSAPALSPVRRGNLQALIPQHDVRDDDDAPLAPQTISALTTASAASATATTCVVCMDSDKDIALAPCEHSHCCLACFRRSAMRSCPICRTPVASIVILNTGMAIPVSLVAPKPFRDRPVQIRSSGNLHDPVLYERPRNLFSRPSMPSLMSAPDDDTVSMHSRTTSMSSVNMARQAESSVRSLPREQHAAFRQLRERGFVQTENFAPARAEAVLHRRNTIASATSSTLASVSEANNQVVTVATASDAPNGPRQNMVLIGHNRKVLMSLAQRLLATFPFVDDHDISARSKSTVYINGEAIRLVLVECPIFSMGPDLVLRVQRQSPKLVLLCADYFNVSSFESIVRLDMEMLDYLNITCVWVLVKSTRRPKESNIVEEADVRVAKHFLSKPRRCFVAPVDGALQSVAMRKLGLYIYRSITENALTKRLPPTLQDKHPIIPTRSLSFFCLRPDKGPEKRSRRQQRDARRSAQQRDARRSTQQRDARRSTRNLARWLL